MVDSLVSIAVEKLNTILQDEVSLLVGVSNEIENLSTTFTSIQALLEDAESRRVKDRSVMIWLEKLKDVAYDVDDILDEWTTETHKSRAADEGDGSCFSKKKVISILSPVACFNHVTLRQKIGSRIQQAQKRLAYIAEEKNLLGLRVDSGERERVDSEVRRAEIRERETGSLLDQPSVVGREDDKNRVVDLLLGESSEGVNQVPFVISVVGMGGVGKTTIAQLTYNDERVQRHFHMKMWVCVSENFDVKQITESIIKSADPEFKSEKLNLDQSQLRLREMLHGKRFLIVLDDIWCEDSEKWDKLKLPFQAGASGSRIVITTRNEKVALAMGRAHICKLAVLSHDDCWLVFWHRALEHRSAEEHSELEDIGREIVKKCGGLPLVAKTIGSAMCSRRTRREWELVLESDIWNSLDVLQGVLPALLLSYHDLPPALKQCFAYLSIFPKDWRIKKDVAVTFWVAQGFIRSDRSRDMEEIGGLYFDDLLRRSLLQDAELDDYRYIVKCKMHDLVHDLAQSVAGSDCSLLDIRKQASLNLSNLRHSLLIDSHKFGDEVASIWATLYKANKLRTLLCVSTILGARVPNNLFRHFRRLRALDLKCTGIKKLPQTVGKLKQLRYLNLSLTNIEELPEGLSNCGNLQTLILNGCSKLKKLPRVLIKMINLRHVDLEYTDELKYLPQGMGRLSSLRTLTKLIVEGGIEGCKWGEVKQLMNHLNLQGRLEIAGLEKLSRDEAREAEVYKKQKLYALSYGYRGYEALDDDEVKRMEEVLEILQPHTNLKELKIQGYKGWKLPNWTEDPVFSNLVKVELRFCDKCKQLPGLGKLPSLKYLRILGMEEVRKVGGEFSGDDNNDGSGGGGVVSFPKLETLIFSEMPNWEEWELIGDGEVMPSLLQLKISYCPKLKEFPSNLQHLIMLQQLTIWNCPLLEERYKVGGEDRDKIAHIPNIEIY